MRCLVTGVAGFIGSSIADRLLGEGHEVIGIDCFTDYYSREAKEANIEQASRSTAFTLIEEDILTADLDALLEGVTWVFHQAAQAGVRASWGRTFDSYTRHNVLATQQLLEACKGKSHIHKIVCASSSSVYGDAETYPTSEALTPRPVSPYGVTKLAAEHLACLYASQFGVPTVSLRYFTVYGPRQRPDMAFHRFIRAALTGEPIELYGDGTQSRDFTFVSDAVTANILAAQKAPSGAVYNIGGGSRTTVTEVLAILEGELGAIDVRRLERQAGDARHTSADTARATKELGFVPAVPLREGLKREIEWLRSELCE